MNKVYLSKSRYCQCVQCEKIFWLNKYKPDEQAGEDVRLQGHGSGGERLRGRLQQGPPVMEEPPRGGDATRQRVRGVVLEAGAVPIGRHHGRLGTACPDTRPDNETSTRKTK